MKTPSVSIVMAVKNEMPHLPMAVESILDQTFKDFEFLVVDDGSTDGTLDYLKGIRDPRLRVLKNAGTGQTAGLNLAIREAAAPWVARMDGDDWSLPERLEEQMKAVARFPDAVLVSTDYMICDDSFFPVAAIHLDSSLPDMFFRYIERRNNPYCHPTMMFRTEVARAVGGYDETLKNAQDFSLWKKLLKSGRWVHVPQVLLDYRVRKQSLSILRHTEQEMERKMILSKRQVLEPPSSENGFIFVSGPHAQEGLYSYKLGFAAWTAGLRALCVHYLVRSLRKGIRPLRSFVLLITLIFPRTFYLSLCGYKGVFK